MNWKDEIIKNAKYYKYIDSSYENSNFLVGHRYDLIIEDLPIAYTTPVSKSFFTYLGGNIRIYFTGSQQSTLSNIPITSTITDENGEILYEKEETLLSGGGVKEWNTLITVKPFQKITISMSNSSGRVTMRATSRFDLFIADAREYIKILN